MSKFIHQIANPTAESSGLRVLRIDASGRRQGSVSRQLTAELVDRLRHLHSDIDVTTRDLAEGVPFVDEDWMAANFTPPEERSAEQQAALADSDALAQELIDADVLIVGTPIYNFGIPAALKAWIDMVARARLTFRYTENGPLGLLTGKRAYLVVSSGGTPVGSEVDFASSHLRHVLGFLGIDDVTVIAADGLVARGEAAVEAARERIARLGHAPTKKTPPRMQPSGDNLHYRATASAS